MTLDELRTELRAILSEEQRSPVDWQQVEALCLRVVERLNTEAEPAYPHDVVYHFLDDPDVRRKSEAFAEQQRHRLRQWLDKSG